ncbi:MAG: hypothetical protein ACLGG1_04680 [Gammaproteobacteria bacterium]
MEVGKRTFTHKGKHWEFPVPGQVWPAADFTRKRGTGVLRHSGHGPPLSRNMPE